MYECCLVLNFTDEIRSTGSNTDIKTYDFTKNIYPTFYSCFSIFQWKLMAKVFLNPNASCGIIPWFAVKTPPPGTLPRDLNEILFIFSYSD